MTSTKVVLTAADNDIVTNEVGITENGFIRAITVTPNTSTAQANFNVKIEDADGNVIYTSPNVAADGTVDVITSLTIPINYGWICWASTADQGVSGLTATVRLYIENV